MITKEIFIKIINLIKEQDILDDNIGNELEKICGGYVIFNTKNKKYKALNILLKEIFNDEEDYIGWWLYDNVKKIIYVDKKKIFLKNAEQLYDFLIENYE